MPHRALSKFVPALLACVALVSATGCNVVAPVAYAIHGPEKIDPVHTLDAERSVVIFIDDPSSKIAQRRLRYAMADTASKALLRKKVVNDVIDSRTILTAASKERHGDRMSITELGRAVGADLVVYAVVTNFSITAEEGTFVPTTTMRVKIIDTAEGQRVWPASESGYLLEVRLPQRPSAFTQDRARLNMEAQLADRSGVALAQLFYRHEVTESAARGR